MATFDDDAATVGAPSDAATPAAFDAAELFGPTLLIKRERGGKRGGRGGGRGRGRGGEGGKGSRCFDIADRATSDALAGHALVAIYFGASWCSCCCEFARDLAAFCEALPSRDLDDDERFRVVFASLDRDAEGFWSDFEEQGDWAAVPFEDEARRDALAARFSIDSLPALVFVDLRNGETVTADGVRYVQMDDCMEPRDCLAALMNDRPDPGRDARRAKELAEHRAEGLRRAEALRDAVVTAPECVSWSAEQFEARCGTSDFKECVPYEDEAQMESILAADFVSSCAHLLKGDPRARPFWSALQALWSMGLSFSDEAARPRAERVREAVVASGALPRCVDVLKDLAESDDAGASLEWIVHLLSEHADRGLAELLVTQDAIGALTALLKRKDVGNRVLFSLYGVVLRTDEATRAAREAGAVEILKALWDETYEPGLASDDSHGLVGQDLCELLALLAPELYEAYFGGLKVLAEEEDGATAA